MDSISPTQELLRHYPDHDLPKTSREKKREAVKINSVVDRLRRNGDIDDREHAAAQRFEKDYHRGMCTPGLTSSYGQGVGGRTPIGQLADYSDTPEDRRSRHHEFARLALDAVTQPEQQSMLVKVILLGNTLEDASRATFAMTRASASAAGKVSLIYALRCLRHHYDHKYTARESPG